MSGKQVAIVAPTTILSRQHFKTFSERFRGWPVKAKQLSRLVTAKEAKLTKEELAKGQCEIVVGTHALLAKSISFSDLGMIIVDEEQRFGVQHKERLKSLRADMHVLTLTATPIPRTLQPLMKFLYVRHYCESVIAGGSLSLSRRALRISLALKSSCVHQSLK